MKPPLLAWLSFTVLATHAAFGARIPMRYAITPDLPSILLNDLHLGEFDLPVPRVPESLSFDGFTRAYLVFYSDPRHDLMTTDFVKTSGYWSRITAINSNLEDFDPPTKPARP